MKRILGSVVTTSVVAVSLATAASPAPASAHPSTGSSPALSVAPTADGPEQAGAASTDAGRRLARRTPRAGSPWAPAVFAKRLIFHPYASAADPARQIESTSLRFDNRTARVSADIWLRAAPSAATDSFIAIYLGRWNSDATVCMGSTGVNMTAFGTSVPGLQRDGRHLVLAPFALTNARGLRPTCAFAGTYTDNTSSSQYDVVIDGVDVVGYDRPRLGVGAPAKVKVRPGRFQKVRIKVSNRSRTAAAPGVQLRVRGAGVAVRAPRSVGALRAGQTKKVTVKVRLKGTRSRSVTVQVNSHDVRAVKRIKVVRR